MAMNNRWLARGCPAVAAEGWWDSCLALRTSGPGGSCSSWEFLEAHAAMNGPAPVLSMIQEAKPCSVEIKRIRLQAERRTGIITRSTASASMPEQHRTKPDRHHRLCDVDGLRATSNPGRHSS